jgi:antitoxin component of MazEF toxin-antitoxin module
MVTIEENVKVVKVGNSLRIVIPAVFSKALGILEGNTVHLASTDHEILVRKLESARSALSRKRGVCNSSKRPGPLG